MRGRVARAIRILAALSAAVVLAVALAARGGGVPSDAVATINGTPITKSTFDHWLGVAAASSTPAAAAGQTATKQVAPDPPIYSAGVAQKKANAPKADE